MSTTLHFTRKLISYGNFHLLMTSSHSSHVQDHEHHPNSSLALSKAFQLFDSRCNCLSEKFTLWLRVKCSKQNFSSLSGCFVSSETLTKLVSQFCQGKVTVNSILSTRKFSDESAQLCYHRHLIKRISWGIIFASDLLVECCNDCSAA